MKPAPLTAHVPVRFPADLIAEVKELAQQDGRTVSNWIRVVIDAEVTRRRRNEKRRKRGVE